MMNEYHSAFKLNYKPRLLAELLRKVSKDHQIVVLSGARQVGKSTLLQNESPFKDWRYITMDDYDVLAQARKEPAVLWAGAENVILDEVQKSPRLMDAVKLEVDAQKSPQRFILSGSANILLMKNVSESLAGRAIYMVLFPMTIGEINEWQFSNLLETLFKGDISSLEDKVTGAIDPLPYLWKGFMPGLMRFEKTDSVLRWWEGYISTYLERDLRQLSQIDSLPDFRRLMTALALRCGKILNQSEVSRDTGITQPTVHRYINLLETTCLITRLPAYTVNRTKRLMKATKIIWNDPGLVTFLSGHYDVESLKDSREIGGVLESMIYIHLNTLVQLMMPKAAIYYWRTSTGKEVDFVIERGRTLLAIEVKLSTTPRYADTDNLRLFIEEYPETVIGVLLHCGNKVQRMHEKIIALPWWCLGKAF